MIPFSQWCEQAVNSRLGDVPGLVAYKIVTDSTWPRKAVYWNTVERYLKRCEAADEALREINALWQVYAADVELTVQFVGGPMDGLTCYKARKRNPRSIVVDHTVDPVLQGAYRYDLKPLKGKLCYRYKGPVK